MGRREGPSEERRQAILQAAEAEFGAQGYEGAAIRAIARRAGVSSALLYWFFPDKAQLFIAVLTARLETLGNLPPPNLDFPDLPPAIFLPQFAHSYLGLATNVEQWGLIQLMARAIDREPQLVAALAAKIVERVLHPLEHYFAGQMARGTLRPLDPAFVAQAFLGMFIGYALRREALREPQIQTWDIEAYVETAVAIFLNGLLTGGQP